MAFVKLDNNTVADIDKMVEALRTKIGESIGDLPCPRCKKPRLAFDVLKRKSQSSNLEDIVGVMRCDCSMKDVILFKGYDPEKP